MRVTPGWQPGQHVGSAGPNTSIAALTSRISKRGNGASAVGPGGSYPSVRMTAHDTGRQPVIRWSKNSLAALMSAHTRLGRTIRATHKFHQRGLLKRAHHAVMAVLAALLVRQASGAASVVGSRCRGLLVGACEWQSVEVRACLPGTPSYMSVPDGIFHACEP